LTFEFFKLLALPFELALLFLHASLLFFLLLLLFLYLPASHGAAYAAERSSNQRAFSGTPGRGADSGARGCPQSSAAERALFSRCHGAASTSGKEHYPR
jgi:hypothetical protein